MIKFFLSFLIVNILNPIISKILTFSKLSNINFRKLEIKNLITKVYYSEKDDNYYVKFYQGNNLTSQTYLLDTTFSLTSSPCNLCDACERHLYPFFSIDSQKEIINCNSQNCTSIVSPSSCQNENCFFNIEHNINKDKNIEGILINSKILINDTYDDDNYFDPLSLIISIPTGCTTKEGNFYKNKEINGILGLNNGNNTFIDILYDLNIVQNNYYTICLSRKGGYLSLGQIMSSSGSYDNNNYNINYINLIPKSQNDLFELKINYIQIGELKTNQEYISYIDSSSKFSYFPSKLYNEIINNFNSEAKKRENKDDLFIVDDQYGYCRIFNSKKEENLIYEKYPNIIINFDGFNFEWESHSYIISYEIKEQNIVKSCFGLKELFENNNDEFDNNKVILGSNFMIEHEIIFDKTNQKIGFINSNCQQIEFNNDFNKQKDDMKNETLITENSTFNTDEININSNDISKTDENINETIINELYNDTSISNTTLESTIYEINDNLSNIVNSDELTISYLLTDIIDEERNYSIMNSTNEIYKAIIENNKTDFINDSIMIDSIYVNETENLNNIINYSSISTSTNNLNYTISDIIPNSISDDINDNTILNSMDNTIKPMEDKIQKIDHINNFQNYSTLIINNKILSTNIITEKKVDQNLFQEIKSTIINVEKENLISEKMYESSSYKDAGQKENNNFNENDSDNTYSNYNIENQHLKDKSFISAMLDIIKSFLKNKFIYFLLALIGIIACFFLIILISCAIINCFKVFKRRNYMEQIDEDIPNRDYNYKTATINSSRSN